jgi:hypothetical protein
VSFERNHVVEYFRRMVGIDEPALREGLPLRVADRERLARCAMPPNMVAIIR